MDVYLPAQYVNCTATPVSPIPPPVKLCLIALAGSGLGAAAAGGPDIAAAEITSDIEAVSTTRNRFMTHHGRGGPATRFPAPQ